jgi:hypothetical protein
MPGLNPLVTHTFSKAKPIMNHSLKRASTCRLWCFALLVAFCTAAAAQAQQPRVYKIEEDWELVVSSPRPAIHSPQISIYTMPNDSNPGVFFQLQLNYAARKDFSEGGFMVSAIRNGKPVQETRSDVCQLLAYDGEQLRWTSVMAVIGNELLLAIKDGQGSHWGSFGGPDYIVRMPAQGLTHLDGYTPQSSKQTVDVSFGANHVQSLVLKRARAYYTDDQVVETVFSDNP